MELHTKITYGDEGRPQPRHSTNHGAIAHGDAANKKATHLYEVKTVKLLKRSELTLAQAGKIDSENDARYWLFELGYAQVIPQVLALPVLPHFKILLTSGNDILAGKNWVELPARYALLT